MNILYVSIDSTIVTLFTKDDTIIAYTEFERDLDLLDKLSSLINACEINKIIFMVRGMYSTINDSQNFIGCSLPIEGHEFFCNVANEDMEVIRHLCQVATISSYRIVDRLGYFASIKKNNVCYVSPYGDMTEVVVVSNGVKDIIYTRSLNIESVLLQCKRNYGVINFVDVNTYADASLLSKFKNIKDITDKKALVNITMLAYLDTDASNFFELEYRVLKEESRNTHVKWQGFTKGVQDFIEEVQNSKKETNISVGDVKQINHGTFSSILTVGIVFLFIVSIVSFAIIKYVSQDATAIAQQKANIAVEIDNYRMQETSLHKYLENYSSSVYTTYLSKILAIKTKCCIGIIDFNDNNFTIIIYASKEKDFNKLKNKLAEQFIIESYQNLGIVSVNDSSMTKYELVVTY